MKKRQAVPFYNILILIAIACLLFIRYIEVFIDYRMYLPLFNLLFKIYEYIAIPGFYFFTAAYIVSLFILYFNIEISPLPRKIMKYVMILFLLLFAVFAGANILKIINIHYFNLISIYSLLFSILGCLFALTANTRIRNNKKEV